MLVVSDPKEESGSTVLTMSPVLSTWYFFHVLFLFPYAKAALDEYDMKLEEDNRTNRMEESLQLFGEVTGSQFFAEKDISWILFLNKSDLFRDKISQRPLSKFFKDYPPDRTFRLVPSLFFLFIRIEGDDFESSVRYIQDKYEKKYRGSSALYPYTTCAIDTKNCDKVCPVFADAPVSYCEVFAAVRDSVLTGALEDAGF